MEDMTIELSYDGVAKELTTIQSITLKPTSFTLSSQRQGHVPLKPMKSSHQDLQPEALKP